MTKDFYDDVYAVDHPSAYGGGEDGMPKRTELLSRKTKDWLKDTGLIGRPEAKILEIGCGMAFLANIHPGWCGVEYSRTAVERVKLRDGRATRIFEEDAQRLSFPDQTFDGVFTWAALEHVPDPNKAFSEIDRVLVGGGYCLIAPAWNCRSWTVKKIEQLPWVELSMLEKLERLSIPLRELLVIRAMGALPFRLWAEVKLALQGNYNFPLRFKTLQPRWDLIDRFGHVSDDDAVSHIDPHAGICFFRSRGYQILSHPTLAQRLTSRHEPLIVRKPP